MPTNPHYQRLARHYCPPPKGETYPLGLKSLFFVGTLINCLWLQGLSAGWYSLALYGWVGDGLIASLGAALGIYATFLVSHDTTQIDFELILLTPLSAQQVVHGYLRILLQRLHSLIYLALGFLWLQSVMLEFLSKITPIERTLELGTWVWIQDIGFLGVALCLGVSVALGWRSTPHVLAMSVALNGLWAGLWLVVGNGLILLGAFPLIVTWGYYAVRR